MDPSPLGLGAYALASLGSAVWAASRWPRASSRGALTVAALGAALAGLASAMFALLATDGCSTACERGVQPGAILLVGALGLGAGLAAMAMPKPAATRAATWVAAALAVGFGLGFGVYFFDEMSRMGL